MAGAISFENSRDGVIVRIGVPPVPVREWTTRADAPAGAGALMRLRDEGAAVERTAASLLVYWSGVASLTSDELLYVGLPDAAPFTLEVLTNGAILDPAFEIRCGFIRDGRRVLGVRREGAWLRAGNDDFILLDPLYSIVEDVERFRRFDEADIESRMLRWGRLKERLPADAVVDGHLRTLSIVVGSSFTLDPFVSAGEPDFDPVVGRRVTRITDTGEDEQVFERLLPAARQQEFARRFRGLSRVKHRYVTGGNTYVVLTPDVERALGVVRRAQDGAAEVRRDFLQNVSGYLRGAFDTESGAEPIETDSVFSDHGLSERVRGVGIWVDKVLPWIQQAAKPWLPPETLGLRIGGKLVSCEPDELPGLLSRLEKAVQRGTPSVDIAGIDVPATQATIEAVKELIRRLQPVQEPDPEPRPDPDPREPFPSAADQVLIVIDNLETVGFRRERKKRQTGISSTVASLNSTLLPHQRDGLAWLQRHWDAGSWGVLLADDMGLGKTIEALAFLSCLQLHARARGLPRSPMLIVAPTGLLRNWRDEHGKHLSGNGLGSVVEAHGHTLQRLRDPNRNATGGGELAFGRPLLDERALTEADWVLTTYETLRDYQHSFGRISWAAGIFDEAQKIKNPGARVTDAALAMNVDFAVLMTGTPVENRTADVWSLLDRAEPGRFGTLKDFSRQYEAVGDSGPAALAALHRELTQTTDAAPALMLRRLKEDHLPELPEKRVHRYVVDMPPQQAEAYAEVVLRHEDRGMLETLHRLRSISLHPAAPSDGSDVRSYIHASARLSETFRILDKIAQRGEKALLFVEARAMQDFLIGALRRRFSLADDVLVVNGSVSGRVRKERVDVFQDRSGFDVMILSPRAGGVGLTLTAANHVIHLSRWWNPAVEDQCTDRVFRIGQRLTVHVYLPLARHPSFGDYSFDLKLDGLMARKRDRNRRVLAPVAPIPEEVEELYRGAVTDARTDVSARDTPRDIPDIETNVDLLEPTAFEEWVLRQLQQAGYETRRTPRSGDRGADGLARSSADGTRRSGHTLVVQCKHTQPDCACGVSAVEEVLRSIPEYRDAIQGDPRPMVVTNASRFTAVAERRAREAGVQLVNRHDLPRLRTWNPELQGSGTGEGTGRDDERQPS